LPQYEPQSTERCVPPPPYRTDNPPWSAEAAEAAGLISRSRNASDERQLVVELTAAGRALRSRADEIPPAVVAQLGVELADPEELREVLQRVNAAAITAANAGTDTARA
jgi:hypothetical protein